MRLYLIVGLVEAGMLASVLTVSHLRAGSLEAPVSSRASSPAQVVATQIVATPPPDALPAEPPRSRRRKTREARLKLARLEEARAAEARARADEEAGLSALAKAGAKQAETPPSGIAFAALPQPPAPEHRPSREAQATELAPNLQAAILRMEGMFDPTRVALFGPSLRMMIRPGTAEMIGISGTQWRRVSYDPNTHTRTTYMALAWFRPIARDCADFWLFRPDDTAVALDEMKPPDCRTLHVQRPYDPADPQLAPVVAAPLSLPAFLAPNAGNRLSREAIIALHRARIAAIKDSLFFKRRALFGSRSARPMVAARMVVRMRGN